MRSTSRSCCSSSRRRASAFFSSLLVLALVVPSTVAGIVAGTAADVLPKRLLASSGNLARAGYAAWLPVQRRRRRHVLRRRHPAGHRERSSRQSPKGAILPAIVERTELARANAISQAVGGAAQLVGFGILTPVVLRVFDSPRDAVRHLRGPVRRRGGAGRPHRLGPRAPRGGKSAAPSPQGSLVARPAGAPCAATLSSCTPPSNSR